MLFAQADPDGRIDDPGALWLTQGAWTVLWFAYLAFWIGMIVECLRKDPDRFLWIWLIVFLHPIGPFLYFLLRWLPNSDVKLPKGLKRWMRGSEITRLRTAAMQIGNAHQFIELGNALLETRQVDQAGEAYREALEKEPDNPQALWGAARVDMEHKDFATARDRLERLLEIDPQYKFGDVSLAYGKTLCELGCLEQARDHMQQHVQKWRQPEGLYLLATLHVKTGEPRAARRELQALLMDVNSSPTAIARRHAIWRSRARRMLRKLPADSRSE